MRLFVALEIENEIRTRISRFLDGIRGFAPEVRWVRPESLHVTLKFIGETDEKNFEEIKNHLSGIRSPALNLNFRGYGFFPTAQRPRVFWIGVECGPTLATLASAVDETLAVLNIPREEHAFNPHLTLARAGGSRTTHKHKPKHKKDAANALKIVQDKLSSLHAPEFGTMAAREFFLYQSTLLPDGSRYTKLAGFRLQ
jgi:RNA 2',3'-cyclic 3'-phosphodiesterase